MRLLLLLLFPLTVSAAPFLTSDPTTNADTCVYQEGSVVTRTPLVSNACHADLGAVTPGTHTLTVWFENSLWGTASATVPFTFSRPVAGTGPTNLGIGK